MYDEAELKENMIWWLQQQSPKDQSPDSSRESLTSADSAAQEAIFFLIFAIGAQASPEDNDELPERYFNYGRYLTVCGATVEPSISNIQAYILLSMYLLAASRRNASFMYLGIAVRAAYALGIHWSDINAAFEPSEYAPRERLWRVLRVLDLFLSTSLGRPPSTTETRDTKAENNYSASNDLCAIFEAILTQVYSTRTVSTSTIEKISEQHRLWTTRFASGLATDGIQPEEFLDLDHDGTKGPNIGLFHLKEAYYWTIMLLSRPFLIENISRHIAKSKVQYRMDSGTTTPAASPHSPSDDILAYACVDSAIRTMSLLRGLLNAQKVPKRLPFIVNSAFVSALVLGFAQFGDLDRVFPIGKSLAIAQKVLALFGKHDPVSKRYAGIVSDLQAACEQYLEKRARGKMERHSVLIGGLFGTVEDGKPNLAAAAVAADAAATRTRPERAEDGANAGSTPAQLVETPRSSSATQPQQNQQQEQQQRKHQEIQNVLSMHRGIPGVPGPHSLNTPGTQHSGNAAANRDANDQTPMPAPSPHQHNQAMSSIQQHPPTHQIPSYSGIDFTPPSTDGNDDFLGLPNAVEGADTLLGQHHASAYDMDDSSQQLLPHMSGLPDMIMAMSPRMLSFDSFDKSLQLFPTMDTTGFL